MDRACPSALEKAYEEILASEELDGARMDLYWSKPFSIQVAGVGCLHQADWMGALIAWETRRPGLGPWLKARMTFVLAAYSSQSRPDFDSRVHSGSDGVGSAAVRLG